MSLRTVACGMVSVVVVTGFTSGTVDGVYDIDNPVDDAQYLPNSNIYAWGNTDMGEDVYVKLEKGISTGAEQLIQVPPQDLDWDYNFVAPSGGWAIGTDWACKLWDSDDLDDTAIKDFHEYRIVGP